VDAASFRAGDADRERVAERLRVALEEGRLNLHEYDDRLRQAYAARTHADLDALIADLPGVTPPSQSQVVPAATAADNAAAWRPTAETINRSHLKRFMDQHGLKSFDALLARSTADIAWFTDAVLKYLDIRFARPYDQVVDLSRGPAWPEWCAGGELNITTNCLDKYQWDWEAEPRRFEWTRALVSAREDLCGLPDFLVPTHRDWTPGPKKCCYGLVT